MNRYLQLINNKLSDIPNLDGTLYEWEYAGDETWVCQPSKEYALQLKDVGDHYYEVKIIEADPDMNPLILYEGITTALPLIKAMRSLEDEFVKRVYRVARMG